MTTRAEIEKCIAELEEAGTIGLDLSPGDPLCKRAAALLRELMEDAEQVRRECELLGTVVRTGYPPPDGSIKDDITRRSAARAVDLHRQIESLQKRKDLPMYHDTEPRNYRRG